MSDALLQGGRPAITIPATVIRADARAVLTAALDAADPAAAVHRALSLNKHRLTAAGHVYDLRRIRNITAVAVGKAAVPMAGAVAGLLRRKLDTIIAVAPSRAGAAGRIEVFPAGHPVPDRRGLRAARRVLAAAEALGPHDLLIVLLSGGASSLLPLPDEGLSLADKQRTTGLLLRSGATIAEMNAVRKHLSAIKGGRLAAATRAKVLTLALSDVAGDDPGVIGSGPTAPDQTKYIDAVHVIRRYKLWERLPTPVRIHLVEGVAGWRPETPKPRSPVFRRVRHVIVGNNRLALEAAAAAVRHAGYGSVIVKDFVTGEAATFGRWMGELGKQLAGSETLSVPVCVLAGGETTVTVRGSGRGGRAQEFALAAANTIQGVRGVWVMAIGTDGRDGPTDAAGALVDGETVARGKHKRLDAAAYLTRNDSYTFFKKAGGLIKTGLTGGNVNDLYLVFVQPKKEKRRK